MQYHFSGVLDIPAPSAEKKEAYTKDDSNFSSFGSLILGTQILHINETRVN